MPSGPVTEITLLDDDGSDGFPGITDDLPWQGHGSVKRPVTSWALDLSR